MGLEDIDRYGFPNIGNSPFYTTEFNIASMLPQIEVSGPILRKTMFHTGNEIIDTDEEIENEDDDSIIHINEAANYSNINKYPVFIILQHSGTLMANAIKMMTHHEYTHVCISFSSKMSPMYTFGNKKATTIGAKAGYVIQSPKDDFYKNYKVKYAVYVMYVSENEYKQMKKSLAAFNKVKDSWKYDFGNLIKLYTGISSEESNKYFCSKFVAKIINDGHRLDKVPSLWFPNDFTSLDNISLINSGDDFSQYDYRVTEANLDMIKSRKVTEACKDTLHARKFINEVKVLAKRYNANYFIVTDGASGYSNGVGNGVHNPAVDNARDKQIEWEKNNGFDPYEDWSKPGIIHESPSFNQSGIRNIIFDFGDVLIQNRVDNTIIKTKLHLSDNDFIIVMRIYYESVYKAQTESYDALVEIYRKNLPERYKKYAKDIFDYASYDSKRLYPYTIPLINSLKNKGYKVYYLSNWTKVSHDKCKQNGLFNFLKYFDGGIFSYEVNKQKPDLKIYELLLDRYKLIPSECLFIDDQSQNIEAAESLGFNTMLFSAKSARPIPDDVHKLQNMSPITESSNFNESVLISKDDILYKKEEFNSGEINLAFVFGFSGSGKSTMGRDVSGNSIDCDHIELDDVMTNWNFSDDNLKEYSSLLSDFFKGPGKKYRVSQDKLIQDHVSEENYEIPLLKDFIKFAKTYAKSYKNKKFILDGIWPLLYDIQPSEFKDYAVFLKGTSFITSYIRAFKRDKKKLSRVFKDFTDTSFNKCSRKIISNLNKYMNYFTNLEKTINESVKLKRSELPDEVFGIPQERKYPMPDKKHTISAIKLFNHVDKKYEKQLANAILANVNKYGIDVSFVSDKNRFKKYLDEIEERTENDMLNSTIVDDMMREFICESNDPDIPDEIEGIVKILESKGYKVRYASPGHDNTRFYNDRNKDRIINAKLQTTARIIFERDYKFPNTPQGWKWKVLNDRDDKALYVKPYTYNEERMGSPKEAFEKWKRFYLSNLRTWAEDLSRVGHTDNDAPDYNF